MEEAAMPTELIGQNPNTGSSAPVDRRGTIIT
jgi:hypothetical protein